MLRWLSSNPHDHLTPIEQLVKERVTLWRKGAINQEDRMIALLGYPGIGKTFLLNFLKEEHGGVLIDLKERSTYTARQFANLSLERLVPNVEKSKRFILLDNVPDTQDDEQIVEFEREVLLPYWREGALICQCQLRKETVWGQRVPHISPMPIPGLTPQGLQTLRSMLNCQPKHTEAETILFSTAGHIPLLLRMWCEAPTDQKKLEEALYHFLLNWWRAVSSGDLPTTPQGHLLLFAYQACAGKLDYSTMARMIERAGLGQVYTPVSLDIKLRNLFWINSSSQWNEPIRNILQTWLFFRDAETYCNIKNGG